MKRIVLFLATNLAVMLVLSLTTSLLGVNKFLTANGLNVGMLFVFAAVIGFGIVNWPLGKIFLGDGGAYFAGFFVAWTSVLLLWRHPQISAWAPLLICAHPVLEVLFSAWRRRKRNASPGAPDRLHMHSLINRRLVRRIMPDASGRARNSFTGLIMWPPSIINACLALAFYGNTPVLATCLLGYGLAYTAVYCRLARFRWFARWRQPQQVRGLALQREEVSP